MKLSSVLILSALVGSAFSIVVGPGQTEHRDKDIGGCCDTCGGCSKEVRPKDPPRKHEGGGYNHESHFNEDNHFASHHVADDHREGHDFDAYRDSDDFSKEHKDQDDRNKFRYGDYERYRHENKDESRDSRRKRAN